MDLYLILDLISIPISITAIIISLLTTQEMKRQIEQKDKEKEKTY